MSPQYKHIYSPTYPPQASCATTCSCSRPQLQCKHANDHTPPCTCHRAHTITCTRHHMACTLLSYLLATALQARLSCLAAHPPTPLPTLLALSPTQSKCFAAGTTLHQTTALLACSPDHGTPNLSSTCATSYAPPRIHTSSVTTVNVGR
jgi:hypothetical protein